MKPFCQYCQNDPVTHLQQKELCGVCEMETEVANRKKTNADRIRAMTDEELMEFLEHDYWSIDYCKKDAPIDQETKECLLPSCKQCFLEWLKQEADG